VGRTGLEAGTVGKESLVWVAVVVVDNVDAAPEDEDDELVGKRAREAEVEVADAASVEIAPAVSAPAMFMAG
jgi:hypothetical protein